MTNGYFVFLSEIDRESELFKECLKTLSLINPTDWSRERIIHSLDFLKYDCLICTDGRKLMGANAFNPDRQEGIAKSFLLYVSPEYRGQGIGKAMRVRFLKWAFASGFKGAQLGLGNSPAGIAVSEAVSKEREELGLLFADINPVSGKVVFSRV
jgi:GNAT superfamily N-acetyltransferase